MFKEINKKLEWLNNYGRLNAFACFLMIMLYLYPKTETWRLFAIIIGIANFIAFLLVFIVDYKKFRLTSIVRKK